MARRLICFQWRGISEGRFQEVQITHVIEPVDDNDRPNSWLTFWAKIESRAIIAIEWFSRNEIGERWEKTKVYCHIRILLEILREETSEADAPPPPYLGNDHWGSNADTKIVKKRTASPTARISPHFYWCNKDKVIPLKWPAASTVYVLFNTLFIHHSSLNHHFASLFHSGKRGKLSDHEKSHISVRVLGRLISHQ